MNMPKASPINVLEATEEQRRIYATNFLGADIDGLDDNGILSTILAANGGSEIIFVFDQVDEIDMAGTPPQAVAGSKVFAEPVAGSMHGSLGKDDPKVEIFINNEDRNGVIYDRDVSVGVNGRCWLLKRNMTLKIPYRVFLALENAVADSITHDPRTNDENVTPVRRIPYSASRLPSDEEIAEWHERIDALELP